jgi:antitoxin CcdA
MARAAPRVRKVATNVSIRPDLVARAKELGLNLSGLLESAVEQAIRDAERKAWLAEAEPAMDAYNKWAAKHGHFSDKYRKF